MLWNVPLINLAPKLQRNLLFGYTLFFSVTVTGLQTVFAKNNKYGKSELIVGFQTTSRALCQDIFPLLSVLTGNNSTSPVLK